MENMSSSKVESRACVYHFSSKPIFLGGLIAMGLGFLLDLFGKGIGLSFYTTDTDGAMVLAVSGLIGILIGSVATMFPAGFAAGFFAAPNCPKRNFGVVYGFAAWCIGLLLMALLASGFGNYMNAYLRAAPTAPVATAQEVANTTQAVASRLHPATDASDTNAEKNVRAVGMLSLSMFIIFFVGAFSACLGGYFGFYCWHKREECCPIH